VTGSVAGPAAARTTGGICWLASYPKSGNTWFRAVYAAAASGADIDINRLPAGTVPASRELLDDALGLATTDLTCAEIEVLRPRADEVTAPAEGPPQLRKVHDVFALGATGEPIVSVAASVGAIYVVRDPRDVAVSMARFVDGPPERVVAAMGNPAATLGRVAGGIGRHVEQRAGSWSEHVLSWLDQRRLPVCLLRYEDALVDPVGTFEPALRFAGLAPAAAEVETAVRRASFGVLAGQEQRNGFRERLRPHARFFRRGVAGGWRDELPAELADRIVADHGAVMARLGYDQ
jgi:aryl sulfotransferase